MLALGRRRAKAWEGGAKGGRGDSHSDRGVNDRQKGAAPNRLRQKMGASGREKSYRFLRRLGPVISAPCSGAITMIFLSKTPCLFYL